MAKRRVGRYPKEFRRMVVERLKSCDNIVALAQELGLHRRLLYKWRDQLEPLEHGQEPVPSTPELRQQVRQLKRLPAEKTMEIDFFKGALQKIEAGFYRSLQEQRPVEEEMAVRSTIQQIAVEHRCRYGYRRISAELRRRGMVVNHKRVARIMREDNLLAVQPRQFVVTTDSDHKLEVYLNLASRMNSVFSRM